MGDSTSTRLSRLGGPRTDCSRESEQVRALGDDKRALAPFSRNATCSPKSLEIQCSADGASANHMAAFEVNSCGALASCKGRLVLDVECARKKLAQLLLCLGAEVSEPDSGTVFAIAPNHIADWVERRTFIG